MSSLTHRFCIFAAGGPADQPTSNPAGPSYPPFSPPWVTSPSLPSSLRPNRGLQCCISTSPPHTSASAQLPLALTLLVLHAVRPLHLTPLCRSRPLTPDVLQHHYLSHLTPRSRSLSPSRSSVSHRSSSPRSPTSPHSSRRHASSTRIGSSSSSASSPRQSTSGPHCS